MALLHFAYYSQALMRQSACIVVLPDGAGPHPVVYQLHGLEDDYTMWPRRSAIERHADHHQLMVVMPDGGRSFYVDAVDGEAYERHILETVQLIDRTFRTCGAAGGGARGRGIGGLSMGGYGSLKLGLRYGDRFASIAAHSSVTDIVRWCRDHDEPELRRIFGHDVRAQEDLFHLAEMPGLKPAIRIDCGTEDELIDDNRRLHSHLFELGVPHDWCEYPGGHDWTYWDAHIERALRFHRQVFDASG